MISFYLFSRVSKDYYAPALGGIMLSIGIRLSLDDFALAFQRFFPFSFFLSRYMHLTDFSICSLFISLFQTFAANYWIYCTVCA